MNDKAIGYLIGIIIGIGLLILTYMASNQFYFDEVDAQILKSREDYLKLKSQNDESQRISDNIDKLEQDFSKAEGIYNDLKPLLPSEAELPTILKAIEKSAINRNLKLDLFSQSQSKPVAKGITELPIQVEISGLPDDIGRFVEELSRFPRILHVNSCRMAKLPMDAANPVYQGVRATINISAFVVPESNQKLAKTN